MQPFQVIVVGAESMANLRLADIFRKLVGEANVLRYLDLHHLNDFLAQGDWHRVAVVIDVFSYDPKAATDNIGFIRETYPNVVFCIYVDSLDIRNRWDELPEDWQDRLMHYYRIYKQPPDTELEPVVRQTLSWLRMDTQYAKDTELSSAPKKAESTAKKDIFISYSREDWESFVSPLVDRLRNRGYAVWVDQHLLVGGEDWMDSIGAALDECQALVLVMSPEALASKFVKMEYRYFFNHDKPMIPLLYRPVERIPPELSITQHIDFTRDDTTAFEQLFKVIESQFS